MAIYTSGSYRQPSLEVLPPETNPRYFSCLEHYDLEPIVSTVDGQEAWGVRVVNPNGSIRILPAEPGTLIREEATGRHARTTYTFINADGERRDLNPNLPEQTYYPIEVAARLDRVNKFREGANLPPEDPIGLQWPEALRQNTDHRLGDLAVRQESRADALSQGRIAAAFGHRRSTSVAAGHAQAKTAAQAPFQISPESIEIAPYQERDFSTDEGALTTLVEVGLRRYNTNLERAIREIDLVAIAGAYRAIAGELSQEADHGSPNARILLERLEEFALQIRPITNGHIADYLIIIDGDNMEAVPRGNHPI